MKKFLVIISIIIFTFSIASCDFFPVTTTLTNTISSEPVSSTNTTSSGLVDSTTLTNKENVLIDLYSLNDFHGGAYSSLETFSKMSEYLYDAQIMNPNSVLLASGDMFQGTAFSNYYYGLPIIEVLNYLNFSAFTIGNHEFDWGIDKIENYQDFDDTNGEANYPFLAANIVYKTTGELISWTKPYEIVEKDGVKIGIIGVIGNVINSISASRVEGIEFLDPVDTISKYAEILRVTEGCDIVVVSLHDYDTGMNSDIASLSGTHLVDAVFNGHTHTSISGTINRTGAAMPFAQVSDGTSSLIAKITLSYNYATHSVTAVQTDIIGSSDLGQTSEYVSNLIQVFESDSTYNSFVTQVLANTNSYISKYDLAPWGASVIRDYLQVDFGILNAGGFRVNIEAGNITMGKLVEVYPFDNYLKTVKLTGADLLELYTSGNDIVFDDQVSYSGGKLYKNGILVESDTLYTVAAVDYVFDKTYNPFLYGEDVIQTTFLMRDLLSQDLLNTVGNFSPSNGTSFYLNIDVGFAWNYLFYQEIFIHI
ncbi:MAG: 5'-nucleotidase C-terminal domain-containing protein [Candidatus Izemoplasmatales bacterium]|jgi:2',3'-cyclic-nucleotide 2'-phosphodiesterase (5'-nucleotidase family)|nr:5'-nucleotidase C-terminal domain-containing protein [Candidatus Izemoplasmatales bacterium]